jgi:uncharacterized protein (TIGR03067 family)
MTKCALIVVLSLLCIAADKPGKPAAVNPAPAKPARKSTEELKAERLNKAIAAEQKKLDGRWLVDSVTQGPMEDDANVVKGMRYGVAGEKVSVYPPGEEKPVPEELTVKIDPTKRPRTIDIISPGSKYPELGIYELKGETLRVYWEAGSKAERPKKFDAKPETNRTLIVLKREKPEKQVSKGETGKKK